MSASEGVSARTLARSEMSAPCLLLEVDLEGALPTVPPPQLGGPRCAWVFVRIRTEPLGTVIVEIGRSGVNPEELMRCIREELGPVIGDRIASQRTSEGGDDSPGGQLTAVSAFAMSRERLLRTAPEITVVVCTRERPEGLERCLESLVRQDYPRFSILVVDNAPTSDRSRAAVARFDPALVQYVVEPRPGLSCARNRGLALATTEVIAWIDDDEIADEHWLAELARGFHDHPAAAAVSGTIMPAELETWPQVRFEQYGGHNKHRGFRPAVFSPGTRAEQDPLFPLPPFGAGGNMAFRREALVRLGGFDVALGAGTPAMGGEDTKAFSEILCDGGTVVYQPTAVTYHFHYREQSGLERQMFGYGVGLTAFYTSMVVSHPALFWRMLRLIPRVLRGVLGGRNLRSGHLPPDFPSALRHASRRGLLLGVGLYVRGRWSGRHHEGAFVSDTPASVGPGRSVRASGSATGSRRSDRHDGPYYR